MICPASGTVKIAFEGRVRVDPPARSVLLIHQHGLRLCRAREARRSGSPAFDPDKRRVYANFKQPNTIEAVQFSVACGIGIPPSTQYRGTLLTSLAPCTSLKKPSAHPAAASAVEFGEARHAIFRSAATTSAYGAFGKCRPPSATSEDEHKAASGTAGAFMGSRPSPKQLALKNAEALACALAPAMTLISRVAAPAVSLLNASASAVFRLFGRNAEPSAAITDEEIRTVVAEAETAGVIETDERLMISGVLRLGDRAVRGVMTPRTNMDWIDLESDDAAIHADAQQLIPACRSRRRAPGQHCGRGPGARTPCRDIVRQPVGCTRRDPHRTGHPRHAGCADRVERAPRRRSADGPGTRRIRPL